MDFSPPPPDVTAANGNNASPAARNGAGAMESLHNLDAERAVIGAVLQNGEHAMESIVDKLRPHHFFDKRHGLIFEACQMLSDEAHPTTSINVEEKLKNDGRLARAGGKAYLAELGEVGAATLNLPSYAEIIFEKAILRGMLEALSQSHHDIFHPQGRAPTELLDRAEARLLQVGEHFSRSEQGLAPAQEIVDKEFNHISTTVNDDKKDKKPQGLQTGFADFDQMTTGLYPGELVIIAGRPGAGKTAFALNIAHHITAQPNLGVGIFSAEMSSEQLVQRLFSLAGKIDGRKMRNADFEVRELSNLVVAVDRLKKRQIYIDDAGSINILEVRMRARRLHRELLHKKLQLGLVVVDYLQLLETDGKAESRATEVAAISRGLKTLAKELKVPIIALSQLNRASDTRPNKRPMLSDLRESGAIEQDADMVVFLHADEKSQMSGSEDGKIEVIIGKHRNGPTGVCEMVFKKRYSHFLSIADGRSHFDGSEAASGSPPY